MKQKTNDKHKVAIVYTLFIMSIVITLSGLVFGVYAYLNNITFPVFNSNVPGVIFALLVIYLGVRYFLSVKKLKSEIFEPDAKFSWNNFKRHKIAKSR